MPQRHQDSKTLKEEFQPITEQVEQIGKLIVDSAFRVHYEPGPGLLEKVYETCFCHELRKRELNYVRRLDIPMVYDGLQFDEELRVDVMVGNAVICELKDLENVNPVWKAQILSHLKLTVKRLGNLINFNVPNIKDGFRRLFM